MTMCGLDDGLCVQTGEREKRNAAGPSPRRPPQTAQSGCRGLAQKLESPRRCKIDQPRRMRARMPACSRACHVRALQQAKWYLAIQGGGFAVTDWPSALAGANVTMIGLGVVALIVLVTLLAPTSRHVRNLQFATLVVCAVLAILVLVAVNSKPEEIENGDVGATGAAGAVEADAADATGAAGAAEADAPDATGAAGAAGGGGSLDQNRTAQIESCVAEKEARVAFTRTFSVQGEARCPGGGCFLESSSCNRRETWASYAAPGTYYLDSYSSTQHDTHYGSIGGLEVTERDDSGRALAARVHLSCDPPDRPGAPGGWSRAVITGIERLRNEEDLRRRIRKECGAAQGP